MASMAQSLVSFTGNLASKPTASDLLRSSRSDVFGVPLRDLGRSQLGAKRRDFTISAKLKNRKKYNYPWPENPDPNVEDGGLIHLSPFKPLKDKPKPAPMKMDIEKPLLRLRKRIDELQKFADENGLDVKDQMIELENRYEQSRANLYRNLKPYQRLQIARHPNRPTFLDHVFNITERFVELHGDRHGYDDPAIVTGLGTINGKTYMFIGQQKGRNTKESIYRNFAMPTPHGYRKALRLMHYAEQYGYPIITFIDTPGAFPDLKSEKLNQGEAIAFNLQSMFALKVPIVSIIIGEGGSGGALAIACANKLLMLENAVYYLASPEAAATIIWKDVKKSPKAAQKLKITAQALTQLKICDRIIPEPVGGAQNDPDWTSQQIKTAILETMDELLKMDTETLLEKRGEKYRMQGYQEGITIDPIRMYNVVMKRADMHPIRNLSNEEWYDEIEEMKTDVLKAIKRSSDEPEPRLTAMIWELNRALNHEYEAAAIALGLEERMQMVREEVENTNPEDELAVEATQQKVADLMNAYKRNLHTAANFPSLTFKFGKLRELVRAFSLLRQVGNEKEKAKMRPVLDKLCEQPDFKKKCKLLKAGYQKLRALDGRSSPELEQQVIELREEVSSDIREALEPLGFKEMERDTVAEAKVIAFKKEVNTFLRRVMDTNFMRMRMKYLNKLRARATEMKKMIRKRLPNDTRVKMTKIYAARRKRARIYTKKLRTFIRFTMVNSPILKKKMETLLHELHCRRRDAMYARYAEYDQSNLDASLVNVNPEA